MKKALVAAVLLLASCSPRQPRYGPTQGPPRLLCKAPNPFAWTDTPWPVVCFIDGDLSLLPEHVAFRLTLSGQDYAFRSEVLSNLNRRVVQWNVVLTQDYWRIITGNKRIGPEERVEIIRPGDPGAPFEPIEGIEQSLDGTFRVTVEMLDGDTDERLAERSVSGRLNCQCDH